jgi:putative DNA primase/helicase
MHDTLAAARALYEAGISVVRVANDGSKAPAGRWKEFQTRRANQQELIQWFGQDWPAIGVVTGDISGNLEMAEIEGRAFEQLQALEDLARDNGLGQLWDKLENGWLERSPSGGIHWFYRLPYTPARNTKLATRPATPEELEENPHEKRKVLAETRGQGGFVVTAPSNGTTHETGKAWQIISGGPATVPTLTAEEHEAFHALLATLNVEPPEPAPAPPQGPPAAGTTNLFGGVAPGEDYNARTDWADILVPAGWQYLRTIGRTRYWRRPGKDRGQGSATTGNSDTGDRLFVFSSSTEFEPEVPYTKFGAYALLHHGGDHSAAASALRAQEYGKEPKLAIGAPPSNRSSVFSNTPAVPVGAPGSAAAPQPKTGPALTAGPEKDPKWQTTGTLATVTDIATKQHPAPAATTPAYTDDFNAHLLIAAYGNELRFNEDTGKWLWWDERRWVEQNKNGGKARELAKQTIRALDTDDNKTAATHKKRSLSAAGITSMLVQAQTDERIAVKAQHLDARGWELNTPAGIIDLRTATLRPADPESLHTKMTAAAPDFETRSPRWEKFLADTFPDEELRDYVQRLVGYSAIGEVLEHILPFGLGEGGNGKGAMFETLSAVLGDYATSAPSGFLMQKRYQEHSTDIASLMGQRMVLNSEVNDGDKFDEAKVKQLAGGDTITARFMRQDNFTFRPTHQMWLFGNFLPGVDAGGNSFWRRLRVVPFRHTVPKDQIIPGLSKLMAGQDGGAVLAWIARGAEKYARTGLSEPAAVLQETAAYERSMDTVGAFLDEECILGPEQTATANALRNAYNRFCDSNGDRAMKGRALAAALAKHGVEPMERKINGVRYYAGARLAATDHRPADDYGQPALGY